MASQTSLFIQPISTSAIIEINNIEQTGNEKNHNCPLENVKRQKCEKADVLSAKISETVTELTHA